MLRWFVGWFKVRFVFTDEQLIDTAYLLGRVDRERLNNELLWTRSQEARLYIIKELIRRGHKEFIVGYER